MKHTTLKQHAPDLYTVRIWHDGMIMASADFGTHLEAAQYQALHEQGIKMEKRAERERWKAARGIRRAS